MKTGAVLQLGAGVDYPVNPVTASYTATAADGIILASAATAAVTITLPTAVGILGRRYLIKRTDATYAHALTIATTSSQTIDGATTQTLITQYAYLEVVSDGSSWWIVNESGLLGPPQTPSYGTGWADGPSAGAIQPFRVRLDPVNKMVHAYGAFHATSATPATTITTLPAGYFNASEIIRVPVLTAQSSTLTAKELAIDTSGNITIVAAIAASSTDVYTSFEYPIA